MKMKLKRRNIGKEKKLKENKIEERTSVKGKEMSVGRSVDHQGDLNGSSG